MSELLMPAFGDRHEEGSVLRTLRAACEIVVGSPEMVTASSLVLPLARAPGAALILMRAVEVMAAEHGLRHRVEVRGNHAVVNLWRGEGA